MNKTEEKCVLCNGTKLLPHAPDIVCPCQIMKAPKVAASIERLRLSMAHEHRCPGHRCYLVFTTLTDGESLAWEDLPEHIQQTWEAIARAALPLDLADDVQTAQTALTELQRRLRGLTEA